jgi:hypothetical protein
MSEKGSKNGLRMDVRSWCQKRPFISKRHLVAGGAGRPLTFVCLFLALEVTIVIAGVGSMALDVFRAETGSHEAQASSSWPRVRAISSAGDLANAQIRRGLQFCSLFELQRRFRELNVAAQVVSIKDRFDVLAAVAGGRNLRHRCLGEHQAHHCRPSQIVERQTARAGSRAAQDVASARKYP